MGDRSTGSNTRAPLSDRPENDMGRPEIPRLDRPGVPQATMEVGGVTVRVRSVQDDLALHVTDRYSVFLTADPAPDVDVAVRLGEPQFLSEGEAVSEPWWRVVRAGGLTQVQYGLCPATGMPLRVLNLQPGGREGELVVALGPRCSGVRLGEQGYIVDALHPVLVELLVPWELTRRGGTLFHASGVDFGGRGCIFIGHSGAGKSTTAGLMEAAGATILSDDRVAITPDGDGFRVHGTPWRGTPSRSRPASCPLEGIFFIEHGARTEPRRIGGAEACAKLAVAARVVCADRELRQQVVTACSALAMAVPCFHLPFTPDESLAAAVDGVL